MYVYRGLRKNIGLHDLKPLGENPIDDHVIWPFRHHQNTDDGRFFTGNFHGHTSPSASNYILLFKNHTKNFISQTILYFCIFLSVKKVNIQKK